MGLDKFIKLWLHSTFSYETDKLYFTSSFIYSCSYISKGFFILFSWLVWRKLRMFVNKSAYKLWQKVKLLVLIFAWRLRMWFFWIYISQFTYMPPKVLSVIYMTFYQFYILWQYGMIYCYCNSRKRCISM